MNICALFVSPFRTSLILLSLLLQTSNYSLITLAQPIPPTNTTIVYKIPHPSDSIRLPVLELELIRSFDWHISTTRDISFRTNFTIADAFLGKHVEVDVERTVVDEGCRVATCQVCRGHKYLLSDGRSASSDTLLQSAKTPCPVCLGLGIVTQDSCNPFKTIQQKIKHYFPPGFRPGYQAIFTSLGNMYYHDNHFHAGDFKLIIGDVESEDFVIKADHVLLTIYLSPYQALNGFVAERGYIDGTLRVERVDKVTIPGSSIIMEGLGLPLPSAAHISFEKLLPIHRDYLMISFELEDESEDSGSDYHITPETGENLDLNSQEMFDRVFDDVNNRREDRAMRNMLLFLTQQRKKKSSSSVN